MGYHQQFLICFSRFLVSLVLGQLHIGSEGIMLDTKLTSLRFVCFIILI